MTVEMNPRIWGTTSVVSTPGQYDAVSMLPDGGYVVAWRTGSGQIKFQLYNGNGNAVGDIKSVDGPSAGVGQWQADIFTKPDGSFAITWTEGTGLSSAGQTLRTQTFDMHGSRMGDAVQLSNTIRATGVDVTVDGTSRLVTGYIKEDGSSFKPTLVVNTANGPTETVYAISAIGDSDMNLDWLGGTRGHATSYMTNAGLAISILNNGNVATFGTVIRDVVESDLVALIDAGGNPTGKFVVSYVVRGDVIDGRIPYRVLVDTFHPDAANNTLVRDSSVALDYPTTDSNDLMTSIVALRGGGYAIAYKGQAQTGDRHAEIYVKVFDAEGNPGPTLPIPVNGLQVSPAISEMADGVLP